jgi:predicted phage tail protein
MIGSALTGDVPARLGTYSTEVTWALDLGLVVPAVAVTAVLLRRGAALGPLAATAMLSLNVALGLALVGQGVAQLLADVPMTVGERVGAMASFAIMTVVAGVLLSRLLRGLPAPAPAG